MTSNPNQLRQHGRTNREVTRDTSREAEAARLRFAFAGRVSTEDLQSPTESRSWQLERAQALVAPFGAVVAEFFDVG